MSFLCHFLLVVPQKAIVNYPDCVKASLLWSHFILIGANQNKNIIVIFAA
jgi:hypothetical protein